MKRTANIFVRVEPENREIPFDMKLSQNKHLSYEELGEEWFNAEIERGMTDLKSGNAIPAEKVSDRMSKDYGL
ncbi:hypothetical protein Q2T46_12985 [Thermoanaerobacterium sp. CMT5567-10]|uniref:hypothetical protein n=1 Tax=Thermoanaerobacterium sp. CMT5567-10 TaxID=3061989 RepID=UPI0026E09928|nr:hypothetical protein [Thermoanaerobacterium sp. CMT5567-10]WKV08435.1 hypothetical protein Q2T46_12985 [Thermoanaerobacterium sp. CMT5567-10]